MQNFLVWTLDCFFDLGIVGIEEDGFSLNYVREMMYFWMAVKNWLPKTSISAPKPGKHIKIKCPG
jgi:hypothetical protein